MKRWIALMLLAALLLAGTACAKQPEITPEIEEVEMRSICELATMDCYYHNVSTYLEKDAAGLLFWKKDEKFWMEYDGIVKLGIDANKLAVEVNGSTVTVTIPQAKVQSCEINSESVVIYEAKNSAKTSASDASDVSKDAKQTMMETASKDATLLARAQSRAKELLENYIKNIGKMAGVDYTVEWKDLDEA